MIYNNYRNDYYCRMYVVLDVFLSKFILHSHIAYCHFSIVRLFVIAIDFYLQIILI